MATRIKYTDEPLGELKVVDDFLPTPDELAVKEENVKVTISLNKSSVEFFKKQARDHHTSYQKMIRRLLDWYASRHQKSA
jgi:predicted DNA binding CopG/RHH family protein